ncbi:MAG: ribosome biogenesis factor YjgA [Kangiellaceae bacterium]|jgi:ribosome-associated protein|nr:ribosome biogenesis factor YjgA [Kangiellaceae bacterium]
MTNHQIDNSATEENDDLKSKTDIKNEFKDITKFGTDLAEISINNLKKLPLSDEIIEAYETLSRIKSNEARKRHFKYIGKRLREIDLEPIELALARYKKGLPLLEKTEEPSESKQWLSRLINDKDNPESFVEQYPKTNRQQLRQMVRNALKNAKSHSSLLQFIQQSIAEHQH